MKKGLEATDKIIYEGKSEDVIWKSPEDKIHPNAKIYSRKDCDVIFLRNGAFMGAFNDKSEYHLADSKRQGKLSKMFKGVEAVENVEFYYINKRKELENPWGTASRIQIYDKHYDMHTSIGANGAYKFRIDNAMKLASKLMGSDQSLSQDNVKEFFKTEINAEIRNALAGLFKKGKYSLKDIAEVTSMEKDVASDIQETLNDMFDDYGVEISRFTINDINFDEDFLSEMSQAKKDVLVDSIRGDIDKDKHEERRKDFKAEATHKENLAKANNPSSDDEDTMFCMHCGEENPSGAKFCVSCGKGLNTKKQPVCPNCNEALPKGAKFCLNCGEQVS